VLAVCASVVGGGSRRTGCAGNLANALQSRIPTVASGEGNCLQGICMKCKTEVVQCLCVAVYSVSVCIAECASCVCKTEVVQCLCHMQPCRGSFQQSLLYAPTRGGGFSAEHFVWGHKRGDGAAGFVGCSRTGGVQLQ
jgi:hypothetical protein